MREVWNAFLFGFSLCVIVVCAWATEFQVNPTADMAYSTTMIVGTTIAAFVFGFVAWIFGHSKYGEKFFAHLL